MALSQFGIINLLSKFDQKGCIIYLIRVIAVIRYRLLWNF